jgi:hypothetical protein
MEARKDEQLLHMWLWVDQIYIYQMGSGTVVWLGVVYYEEDRALAPRLIEQEYWTRLWIIQEIILAQDIQLIYANRRISWAHFEQLTRKPVPQSYHWSQHVSTLMRARRHRRRNRA